MSKKNKDKKTEVTRIYILIRISYLFMYLYVDLLMCTLVGINVFLLHTVGAPIVVVSQLFLFLM